MTPRVVFRADASVEIGTGHVMRCLTLAEALRERGAECEFVCRSLPGDRIDEIRRRGFFVYTLAGKDCDNAPASSAQEEIPGGYAAWLGGVSLAVDAEETLAAFADCPADWLIVDHYGLDRCWEEKLRSLAEKIMVIDDLADRSHDCDLLLNQNLGSRFSDYQDLVSESCKLLSGPEFALLRPGFARLRSRSLENRADGTLSRILVSMGGVDNDNATGAVLEAFSRCNLPDNAKITVVMGGRAPWIESVRQQADELQFAVEVLTDVANMAELMADSDFAIGAAGTTSWERCCMGLPSALVVLAENQAGAYEQLVRVGAAIGLGGPHDIPDTLPRALNGMLINPKSLRSMSRTAASICDGRGVGRVVQCMTGALQK